MTRHPRTYSIVFAASALFYPACQLSVGDGDWGGTGGGEGGGLSQYGGEGGEVQVTGGSAAGGEAPASGGSASTFVPLTFVPPQGLPAQLPEVVRMGGYSADSAALRIRDAFRATYGALANKVTSDCGWGTPGRDYYIDVEQYTGLCSAACLAEHLTCDPDAELYVCDVPDSSNTSTDVATCLAKCEEFKCDDDSSAEARRCNFVIDCDDASDEKGCGDLAFLCADGSESLSGFAVCDGEDDCTDASDEKNCGSNGYVCSDGVRIQAAFQCDGSADCTDGADEEGCEDLVYDCGGDGIIPWFKTCDGEANCADGSDETLGCFSLDEARCTP